MQMNNGLRRSIVAAIAVFAMLFIVGSARTWAQVSPAGGGAERPPTAAKASAPSPDTGKQLEPQLFGFLFVGGGIIAAIAVVLADRRARSDFARYSQTAVRMR